MKMVITFKKTRLGTYVATFFCDDCNKQIARLVDGASLFELYVNPFKELDEIGYMLCKKCDKDEGMLPENKTRT
jgi:hypothetical protein